MNCANHPDRERTAFCQNCGKPLCTECIRNVGASIFCEPCLAARVAATAAPGYGYAPTPGSVPPAYSGPPLPGEPSPGLAALLGFIPGVGAMYNGQYAKGLVHLLVFAILVSLAHENGIFGLFLAGWIFYMAIEAHHTARARRDGLPLPDPFGLNDISERLGFGRGWPGTTPPVPPGPTPTGPAASGTAPSGTAQQPPPFPSVPPGGFSGSPRAQFVQEPDGTQPYYSAVPPVPPWGAPQDSYSYTPPPVPPVPPMPIYPDPTVPYARRIPTGAIWLIGLGLFFLLGNSGIFTIHARFFGPLLLIGIAVWIFVRKMTATGQGFQDDGTPLYRWRLTRAAGSAFWVLLVGIIWLLDVCNILSWGRSWPLFLIGGGIWTLFRRSFSSGYVPPTGYGYGYGPNPYPAYPAPPAAPPVTSTSLVPTDPSRPDSNPEGR